jgi:hypothetical protein
MCPRSRGSDPEEVTSWGVGARQYNDNDKSSEASIIAVAEVTPKLRTALPAEVDKLLIRRSLSPWRTGWSICRHVASSYFEKEE